MCQRPFRTLSTSFLYVSCVMNGSTLNDSQWTYWSGTLLERAFDIDRFFSLSLSSPLFFISFVVYLNKCLCQKMRILKSNPEKILGEALFGSHKATSYIQYNPSRTFYLRRVRRKRSFLLNRKKMRKWSRCALSFSCFNYYLCTAQVSKDFNERTGAFVRDRVSKELFILFLLKFTLWIRKKSFAISIRNCGETRVQHMLFRKRFITRFTWRREN